MFVILLCLEWEIYIKEGVIDQDIILTHSTKYIWSNKSMPVTNGLTQTFYCLLLRYIQVFESSGLQKKNAIIEVTNHICFFFISLIMHLKKSLKWCMLRNSWELDHVHSYGQVNLEMFVPISSVYRYLVDETAEFSLNCLSLSKFGMHSVFTTCTELI